MADTEDLIELAIIGGVAYLAYNLIQGFSSTANNLASAASQVASSAGSAGSSFLGTEEAGLNDILNPSTNAGGPIAGTEVGNQFGQTTVLSPTSTLPAPMSVGNSGQVAYATNVDDELGVPAYVAPGTNTAMVANYETSSGVSEYVSAPVQTVVAKNLGGGIIGAGQNYNANTGQITDVETELKSSGGFSSE